MTAGTTLDPAPRRRSRVHPIKQVRRWVRFQSARAALHATARAPRGASRGIFGSLGELAYWVMTGQRRLVRGQIDRVYGDRPASWRRRTARRAFTEIALSAVDVARLVRERPEDLLACIDLPPEEQLEVFRGGRGAIAIGGHLGAWELLPPLLAALGIPVSTLVRPVREARLDRLLTRVRRAHGVELLPRANDSRPLLRALRSGRTLAIAADQKTRGRTVRGRLLGLEVALPAGPASLALAAGVPLVPVAMRRRGSRHELLVGDRLDPPVGGGGDPVVAMTRAYAERLGSWIEEAPEQWAWFHERFAREAEPRYGAARARA